MSIFDIKFSYNFSFFLSLKHSIMSLHKIVPLLFVLSPKYHWLHGAVGAAWDKGSAEAYHLRRSSREDFVACFQGLLFSEPIATSFFVSTVWFSLCEKLSLLSAVWERLNQALLYLCPHLNLRSILNWINNSVAPIWLKVNCGVCFT